MASLTDKLKHTRALGFLARVALGVVYFLWSDGGDKTSTQGVRPGGPFPAAGSRARAVLCWDTVLGHWMPPFSGRFRGFRRHQVTQRD